MMQANLEGMTQCMQSDLTEKVMFYLNKYHFQPGQINLEITETAANTDQDIMEEYIRNLSGRGIYFSLDDYGTGYSNLSRMMSLPFHLIKPDKSLVDKLDEDNMQLTEMGCDYIQGYYFSRPLPKQEFVDFIQNSSKVDEVEHHSLIW